MSISISIVGTLYVIGGEEDHDMSSQVDMVDVISGMTSRGPSMRHPRLWHATAVSTTLLFVFGGFDDTAENVSCEVFNPSTRQ